MEYRFDYEKYESPAAMSEADRVLTEKAREACGSACAPYSGFRVGAAARLRSGLILTGSNQESEVFPSTMCAERTLLFHWQAHFSGTGSPDLPGTPHKPADPVEALAIASVPGARECYPCGQCRQSLLDTERRQGSPIRIIMCSDITASVVGSAKELLPFQFEL